MSPRSVIVKVYPNNNDTLPFRAPASRIPQGTQRRHTLPVGAVILPLTSGSDILSFRPFSRLEQTNKEIGWRRRQGTSLLMRLLRGRTKETPPRLPIDNNYPWVP